MKSNTLVYVSLLCVIFLVVSWTTAAGRAQPPAAAEDDGRSINSSSIRYSLAIMSSAKMIVLKSSDGESFEVEELVALESQTIKHMIEDECTNNGFLLLPNVTSRILAKVIEYCKRHVQAAKSSSDDEELKTFDAEFVKVDHGTLFEMILAADYLNIKSLLDMACQTLGDMIKGKTPKEIRKMFNIKNDFITEEEEKFVRENAWAFE